MNTKQFGKLAGLSLLAMVASVTACTDLNVVERDSIVVESAGGGFTAGNPTELLNGLYLSMGTYNDQANIYSLNQHTSREMIPPTRGVDWGDNGVWRTLHSHTWDATHEQVLNTWNFLNSRSFVCEQILASNPSATEAAEAKALRGFFVYQVLDLWGQVPRRTVTQGVDDLPTVLTRSEAFDFAVKDLEEAIPALPEAGPAAVNPRMSKAAARTILARMLLNKGVYKAANPAGPYTFDAADMDRVIALCDQIKAAGFDLDADFYNPFTSNTSTDKILTVLQGAPRNRWMMTLHYDITYEKERDGPWNGFATLADFYDTFQDGDERKLLKTGAGYGGINKGFLIGQQFRENGTPIIDSRSRQPLVFTRDVPLAGAQTNKGIRVIKYHPTDFGQYLILRYSDVHLMKAEAQLRKNNAAAALALVNELRALRNVPALASLNLRAMLDERARELYWEGVARIDEIRFGVFNTQYQDMTNTAAHTVLFPIPAIALSSNANLKQNEGY